MNSNASYWKDDSPQDSARFGSWLLLRALWLSPNLTPHCECAPLSDHGGVCQFKISLRPLSEFSLPAQPTGPVFLAKIISELQTGCVSNGAGPEEVKVRVCCF